MKNDWKQYALVCTRKNIVMSLVSFIASRLVISWLKSFSLQMQLPLYVTEVQMDQMGVSF
jgi:hypothetical protein